MATTVLELFPARVAIGRTQDGKPIFATPEFIRALAQVLERLGGPAGPSVTDLGVADDEDSGLEEMRAEQAKANDAFDMLPPVVFPALEDPLYPIPQEHVAVQALLTELNGLREEIAVLRTEINNLQQGSLL